MCHNVSNVQFWNRTDGMCIRKYKMVNVPDIALYYMVAHLENYFLLKLI